MNQLVEKALKLHQDAANARQEAISALLGEQQSIGDQLKALGHIQQQKVLKHMSAASEKICTVCNTKGHDGRFHRRDKPKSPAPPESVLSTAKPVVAAK